MRVRIYGSYAVMFEFTLWWMAGKAPALQAKGNLSQGFTRWKRMTEWNWRWKRYRSDCRDSRTMKMNDRTWDVGSDPDLVKMDDSRSRRGIYQLSPRGSCEAGNQHSATHDSQIITKLTCSNITTNRRCSRWLKQAVHRRIDVTYEFGRRVSEEWVVCACHGDYFCLVGLSVCLIHLRSWLFPERHASPDHPACARRCDCSLFTTFKPSASSLHSSCTPLLLPRTPPPIIPGLSTKEKTSVPQRKLLLTQVGWISCDCCLRSSVCVLRIWIGRIDFSCRGGLIGSIVPGNRFMQGVIFGRKLQIIPMCSQWR